MSTIENAIFVQALECTWAYHPFGEEYVQEFVDGGVTAINETVAYPNAFFSEIVNEVYKFRRMCDATESVLMAATASDIEKANKEEKLAAIIGLQNLPPGTGYYPDDLAVVDALFRIGVRIIQLTYQRRNQVGDGCGERTDCGLSKFGLQVVEEMNKLGLLIDLSHVGPVSTMDTIEASRDPVVFSHSNCRALCDHVRNKYDEQIMALAEKGGVQGIGLFPPLLSARALPNMDDFMDHMEHVIELVGVDHVGVGLDFSTPEWPPHPDVDIHKRMLEASRAGARANWPELGTSYSTFIPGKGKYRINELDSPSKWRASIITALDERGYASSEIKKVLGENFMRVFRKVWGK